MLQHFKKRMFQRFNIILNDHLITKLLNQIQNGNSECVETLSNVKKVHKCNLEGQDVFVVYNTSRKIFHTVLPKTYSPSNHNWISDNKHKSASGILYN